MADTDKTPLVIPTPVPVALHQTEPRMVTATRFLSWLTAVLLSTAVIIALVSVSAERNDLRSQLREQSAEILCRTEAAVEVNRASAEKQAAMAQHEVIIGDFVRLIASSNVMTTDEIERGLARIVSDLTVSDAALEAAGDRLESAVIAQEIALKACSQS